MIWKLKERQAGPFERSLTFSSRFKKESIEMNAVTGVLFIELLKDHDAVKEVQTRLVIESEI